MKFFHPHRQLEARIKLTKYRRILGQEEMARLLKTTRLSIRNWESGKIKMRQEIIEAIEAMPNLTPKLNTENKIIFIIEND